MREYKYVCVKMRMYYESVLLGVRSDDPMLHSLGKSKQYGSRDWIRSVWLKSLLPLTDIPASDLGSIAKKPVPLSHYCLRRADMSSNVSLWQTGFPCFDWYWMWLVESFSTTAGDGDQFGSILHVYTAEKLAWQWCLKPAGLEPGISPSFQNNKSLWHKTNSASLSL